MKKLVSAILLSLVFFGCGERKTKEKPEKIYYDLNGAWSLTTTDSKNPAVTTCYDQLLLNSDRTFKRTYKCVGQGKTLSNQDFDGYYEIFGDKITFHYVHNQPEMFGFYLVGNEMRLVKNDQVTIYYRTPL